MGFKDFFSNRTETLEQHRNKDLQTRYYKANKSKVMQAVKSIIESDPQLRLLDYSEDHGEITAEYIKPRKAFVVVSVITVFPYRTAVDFTITTSTLFLPIDWGFSRKATLHLYEKVNKELEFIGVGLTEKKDA
ncbi:cytosolic protein [Bacillus horti]|uniref:Cytosolic protein n=1 Tax=Caldalkalibacillus horti TaxID=77523 RepID=A0ABT9VWD1_9BACI|nr:cytosolic protein [Bacillus horti]MDQ0165282.1 hypothetical protein [Bacillus horti]